MTYVVVDPNPMAGPARFVFAVLAGAEKKNNLSMPLNEMISIMNNYDVN